MHRHVVAKTFVKHFLLVSWQPENNEKASLKFSAFNFNGRRGSLLGIFRKELNIQKISAFEREKLFNFFHLRVS